MPAKSAAQLRFMQMIAHGGTPTRTGKKGVGPSPAVAREFIEKTPSSTRKKFARAPKPRRRM